MTTEQNGVMLHTLVDNIGLQVVYKSSDYDRIRITSQVLNRPGLQLTGYLDLFDSDRIQIIGVIETAYLQSFSEEVRFDKFDKLFASGIPALVIAHDVELMPECQRAAENRDITLLKSQKPTSELIVDAISRLNDELAPVIMRHGVFVEIYGEGVLLLGESGLGKSEAAIELIKRGHRLVADDAVNIKKVSSTMLMGSAPDLLRNYIELRGIGVIDVRRIFGAGSVKLQEKIDLVIQLEAWNQNTTYDRLGTESNFTDILDVHVPYLKIPVAPGRNLAVILEVAAMNNRQKRMGYDSQKEFSDRVDHYFDSLTQY